MLVYGKYECFVTHMLYIYVLCASCGSSQCCILNDLQFINAGRGWKRQPYGRGILQSRSHDCPIGSHECLLLFTTSCCCECFYNLSLLVFLYWDFVNLCAVCAFGSKAVFPNRCAPWCIVKGSARDDKKGDN